MERFRKNLLQNAKEFYERFIREQFDAPACAMTWAWPTTG